MFAGTLSIPLGGLNISCANTLCDACKIDAMFIECKRKCFSVCEHEGLRVFLFVHGSGSTPNHSLRKIDARVIQFNVLTKSGVFGCG